MCNNCTSIKHTKIDTSRSFDYLSNNLGSMCADKHHQLVFKSLALIKKLDFLIFKHATTLNFESTHNRHVWFREKGSVKSFLVPSYSNPPKYLYPKIKQSDCAQKAQLNQDQTVIQIFFSIWLWTRNFQTTTQTKL